MVPRRHTKGEKRAEARPGDHETNTNRVALTRPDRTPMFPARVPGAGCALSWSPAAAPPEPDDPAGMRQAPSRPRGRLSSPTRTPNREPNVPHNKSAKKRVKTNEIRRKRNVQRRSRLRHSVRDIRKTIATASVLDESGAKELVAVESLLDRMAGKGLIHKNKAARLKSRLVRQARSNEGDA